MRLLYLAPVEYGLVDGYSAHSLVVSKGSISGLVGPSQGMKFSARQGHRSRQTWPKIRAEKRGVHNVHTLVVGLGRTGAGRGRFGEVFGRGQCLQGGKAGSSPTSGTVFPLVRGCFAL